MEDRDVELVLQQIVRGVVAQLQLRLLPYPRRGLDEGAGSDDRGPAPPAPYSLVELVGVPRLELHGFLRDAELLGEDHLRNDLEVLTSLAASQPDLHPPSLYRDPAGLARLHGRREHEAGESDIRFGATRVAELFHGRLQERLERIDLQTERGDERFRAHVSHPHLDGVELQLVREQVHHPLVEERDLGPPLSPIGPVGCLVGVDRRGGHEGPLDGVRTGELRAHEPWGEDGDALGEGAAVDQEVPLQPEDATAPVRIELHLPPRPSALARDLEVLRPGLYPLYGETSLHRDVTGGRILRIEAALAPEGPSSVDLDDPHRLPRELHGAAYAALPRMDGLGRGPDGEPRAVIVGDEPSGLHRVGADPLVDELVLEDDGCRDIEIRARLDAVHDVRLHAGVDWLEGRRPLRVYQWTEGVVVHLHLFHKVLGPVRVSVVDCGDGLAHVADVF